MHLDQAHALAIRALAEGAVREGLTTFKWDASGTCERPVYRELHVRPGAKQYAPSDKGRANIVVKPGSQVPITVELNVMCRKCDDCRQRRRALWTARARTECMLAHRTWFGTLTLRPEAHLRMEIEARRRLHRGGTRWDTLDNVDQFRERHAQISRELTLWLKRVRKNSGAALRVLLVAEAHESGLPHYHTLVHEFAGTCTHRDLSNEWTMGFTNFKLMKPGEFRAVTYATKYLAKSALARIRASKNYGTGYLALGGGLPGKAWITPCVATNGSVSKTTLKESTELDAAA